MGKRDRRSTTERDVRSLPDGAAGSGRGGGVSGGSDCQQREISVNMKAHIITPADVTKQLTAVWVTKQPPSALTFEGDSAVQRNGWCFFEGWAGSLLNFD